jgi:hypothetical protein
LIRGIPNAHDDPLIPQGLGDDRKYLSHDASGTVRNQTVEASLFEDRQILVNGFNGQLVGTLT